MRMMGIQVKPCSVVLERVQIPVSKLRTRSRASSHDVTCQISGHCSKKKQALGTHKKVVHSEDSDKRHSCEKCSKRFAFLSLLKTHQRGCGPNVDRPFVCDECPASFTYERGLELHKETHEPERPRFKCKMCSKSYAKNEGLTQHVRVHTGEKSFECQQCFKRFQAKGSLHKHMLHFHSKKAFPCQNCDMKFSTKSCRTNHVYRRHTDEKRHACNFCGNRFKTKYEVVIHTRVHTKEHLFSCSHCNVSLKTGLALKKHMFLEHDVKPKPQMAKFECSYCQKKCLTSYILRNHLTKHTGEMLAQCTVCNAKLKTVDYLRKHMVTHTGEKLFKCKVEGCNQKFRYQDGVNSHWRTAHGGPPVQTFQCIFCKAKFYKEGDLEKHVHWTHSSDV